MSGYSQGWVAVWYRAFAPFYDRVCGTVYAAARRELVDAMGIAPGATVLDLGAGTGENLPLLLAAVGPTGRVLAVDYSEGMLAKARSKVAGTAGDARFLQCDAAMLGRDSIDAAMGGPTRIDAIVCTLALSVMPGWREAFAGAWALLEPGGSFGIIDGEPPAGWASALLTPVTNFYAAADITRPTWSLIEGVGELRHRGHHAIPGGRVHVTVGVKPR